MKKIIEGKVVSVKMKNTIVVEIVRRVPHPLYKKILKRSKKYKVDAGDLAVNIGDMVKIVQTRPISKDKHFRVTEVVK